MAAVCARGIAKEIREHPMFDVNDDTRFIAGYIFEMIMGDRDVSEEVWNKVLKLLFEKEDVNLFYNLPEECQHKIYKHIFYTQCLTPLMEDGYELTRGPIMERALDFANRRGRYVIFTERVANHFYNRTTADIRLMDYIFNPTEENMGEALFPSDTEGQCPKYFRLVKKYCK
jgi:hypothetical protein